MLSILSIIPIIGPIVQSVVNGYFSTKTAEINRDVSEAQVSGQIIAATEDDYLLRFVRDLYCTPAVVLTLFVGWDTLWAEHDPSMMWHVATWPNSYSWYPTSVAVFLLGNIGLNMWKRK